MTTILDRTGEPRPGREKSRADLPSPTPVTVNGITIDRKDIAREMQHHPAHKPADAWTAAARALVVRELLLQEARRLGLEPAPLSDDNGRRETEEEALIRQLIDREVATPEPDEAACRRIYEQQRAKFRSSDLYGVRHILIPAPAADQAARTEARTRAETIVAAVKADPGAFASLAATYSACPSKDNGGALGQISRGQTVPEFEAALAEAPVGTVLENPVETRYGFHVVAVDHRIDGEVLPFELVRAQISAWLTARSQTTAVRQYISLLAGRAAITGIVLEAAPLPYGQ